MRNSKKIFYIAGMFSLLIIPFTFWFYASRFLKETDLRVLDFGLPARKVVYDKMAQEYKLPLPENGWKYKTIRLPANYSKAEEEKYKNLIVKLQQENIEKTGIQFELSDNNTYGDFVRLINLMLKTKQDSFGFLAETNSFYVVHFKPIKDREMLCGTDSMMEYINADEWELKNKMTKFEYFLFKLPKESFYILFGYLILLYSAVLNPKITLKI